MPTSRKNQRRSLRSVSGGAVAPCWVSAIVVEFCFSYFAVTYLNEEIGLSKAAAAAGGAAWGVGMAIGRFTFSVRRPPTSIVPSAVTILAGFVVFWGMLTRRPRRSSG